jgi:hypothetical protein
MEASRSSNSNESGITTQNEVSEVSTLALLVRLFGKVLLGGIGFFIGCFLGFLTALYAGWINFGC